MVSSKNKSEFSKIFNCFVAVILICIFQTLLLGSPQFRLVGVHNGRMAIIEDEAQNVQDVFSIDSHVFGEAKLLEISDDSILLSVNGETVRLRSRASKNKDEISYSASRSPNAMIEVDFKLSSSDALAKLPMELVSSIPRPVFRDGGIVGLSIPDIDEGSVMAQAGIQSGDIVMSLNGTPVVNPLDTIQMLQEMPPGEIQIQIERDGRPEIIKLHTS